jgi:polyphosphate glucokinase
MKTKTTTATANPRTLAIDIGGTGLKAAVLDAAGVMTTERLRVATPHPSPPALVVDTLAALVAPLPAFDRISVGFPGVVREGRIVTAPHLGTDLWRGFDLAMVLADRLGKPARVLNDAEVQGLGLIGRHGLECVLTLGTGLGSAVFWHGRLAPHLELSQHPISRTRTYDQYVGEAALEAKGRKQWNERVKRVIATVETLLNYDHLYLGGGNAAKLTIDLPRNVSIGSNNAGITGGVGLWRDEMTEVFQQEPPEGARRRG